MRSLAALPALMAVAAAQAETFGFSSTKVATSADNVQPTATETVSGPINTGRACAQIADIVDSSGLTYPSVDAELAYACLKSVPIDTSAASDTISSIKQMVQFQSTLVYLKDPPKGYANEAVDIIGGLDDIDGKVKNGDYDNEYDFESDIATLLAKAHDGHLGFDGMAFAGAFRWRRSKQVALISASSDGKETPKVWAVSDFNQTGNAHFTPSAVSKIDGKDAIQFLDEESQLPPYHDPDARYNSLFYLQPAESLGYFTNPRFYPGPTLNLTFENGTEHTYINAAVIPDTSSWSAIHDGRDFYRQLVGLSSSSKRIKKRSPHSLPRQLEHPKEAELDRRHVPVQYPEPAIEHSASDVGLAGFFIDTSVGTVGVLMAQTFSVESISDAVEFQAVVEQYITEAKSRDVKKHIIDIRTNGGGMILLGYDTYLQFFPSQKPQLLSRYRGHQASDLLGSQISTLEWDDESDSQIGQLFTSPFNFHSYLNKDLKAFTSWENMYPPTKFHNDSFTDLLRYNLSDPLVTSSKTFSIGVTMTGYGDRSNFTQDPFSADDIVILSDGVCASTCSLFTELMVQQSGVKTLAIGGKPLPGPMQAVGGTKGSLVLSSTYLTRVSKYVVNEYAQSQSEASAWSDFLPSAFAINTADASVNFQDNIRKGLEADGVPTQFLNDSASCRVWYQPTMYLNVTEVWTKAAEVVFGKDGGLDEDACIPGSVTSKEAQQGQGEGNPTTSHSGGSSSPTASKGAAASVGRPGSGWMEVMGCGAVVMASMLFGAGLI